jgi:hypothetical protein
MASYKHYRCDGCHATLKGADDPCHKCGGNVVSFQWRYRRRITAPKGQFLYVNGKPVKLNRTGFPGGS